MCSFCLSFTGGHVGQITLRKSRRRELIIQNFLCLWIYFSKKSTRKPSFPSVSQYIMIFDQKSSKNYHKKWHFLVFLLGLFFVRPDHILALLFFFPCLENRCSTAIFTPVRLKTMNNVREQWITIFLVAKQSFLRAWTWKETSEMTPHFWSCHFECER